LDGIILTPSNLRVNDQMEDGLEEFSSWQECIDLTESELKEMRQSVKYLKRNFKTKNRGFLGKTAKDFGHLDICPSEKNGEREEGIPHGLKPCVCGSQ
jgi:hypothetical protein